MIFLTLSILNAIITFPDAFTLKDGIVEMKAITYAVVQNEDGNRTPLLMDTSFQAHAESPLPAVLFIHGGSWKTGTRADGAQAVRLLAKGDYFAASISYRQGRSNGFPAAVHDCKAAIRFLKENATELGIDPTKIGLLGFSTGGYLAALAGLSAGIAPLDGTLNGKDVDTSVACVGTISGVLMPEDAKGQLKRLYNNWALEDRTVERKTTFPSTYIDRDDPPFYMVCGEVDKVSTPKDTKNFAGLLRRANVWQHVEVIEGSGHRFEKPNSYLGIFGFFDTKLGGHARSALQQTINSLR
ncbi:MAG: alpha/beta hydrolase [Planctomycetes bacterium]|nr:alpha/beta hydrolase [Planctomycetota bacterium]